MGWDLPYLAGNATVSPMIERRLVATLFDQPISQYLGGGAMLLVGVLSWVRLESSWAIAWTLVSLTAIVLRLRLTNHYHQSPARYDPRRWAQLFAVSTWTIGIIWGSAGFVVGTITDPFVVFLVISVQAGYLAVSATRNNAAPAAALGQVYLVLLPLLVACLLTGDPYYMLYSIFVVVHMLGNHATIRFLGDRTVKFLVTDEHNLDLLAQLKASNALLEASNARLGEQANIDGLTSLLNRRAFDEELLKEWQRSVRGKTPISFLMVDIDRFKAYNDRFGHQAGDDGLRLVAQAIRRSVRRSTDLAARYGGEEFAVILPATDEAGARASAEAIRKAVFDLELPHPLGDVGRLSVSVGCTTLRPVPRTDAKSLVALADQALYKAKQDGRNRVCVATSEQFAASAVIDH